MTETKIDQQTRLQIKTTIFEKLKTQENLPYKKTIAQFVLLTGYSTGFVTKTVQAMANAETITIDERHDTITTYQQ